MEISNKIKHRQDCMVCASELIYFKDIKRVKCIYCQGNFESNVTCKQGHYICDSCHSMDANDVIENYCVKSDKTDPLEMAIELMTMPAINMHGPEHHFLIPAVLISSYYNLKNQENLKVEKLKIARKRAKDIKGGFCGFYGNCGAAVGTGIFISIISEVNPLSKENWGLANLMTGTSLISIGKLGGPRCCKRNLFVAIKEAAKFIDKHYGLKMYDYEDFLPKCSFKSRNKECLQQECPYFV